MRGPLAQLVGAVLGGIAALAPLALTKLDERVAWWLRNADVFAFRALECSVLVIGYAWALRIPVLNSKGRILGVGLFLGYVASVVAYVALPWVEGREVRLAASIAQAPSLYLLNPALTLGWLVGPIGLGVSMRAIKIMLALDAPARNDP